MVNPSQVVVMAGFSLTNRILLYASLLASPAAFMTGIETDLPIGAGFLGYTIYQQYIIYVAAQNKQLHALCLLPQYLNTLYAFTYIGGVSAGNYLVSGIMCIGTIAAIIINLVATWIGYLTNMPEGYGVYRFFFFGWRTLTPSWRKMFLCWAVFDIVATVFFIGFSIFVALIIPSKKEDRDAWESQWRLVIDTSLIWGSALALVVFWPIVLWTELIIQKNNIVSETDMISVYLFIVQIALLAIPSIYNILRSIFC